MAVTSVHVLQLEQELTWEDLRALRPAAATYWHPGVTAPRDAHGLPAPDLRSWTVLACWPDARQWQEALDGPGPWTGAAQGWSVLLETGGTHVVPSPARWADGTTTPPFGPPSRLPAAGPVAVVTTAGLGAEDLGAALRFLADVQDVVQTLSTTPGSLGFRLGGAEHFPPQVDPFTFSLWQDASAARAWAYGQGVHAAAMARHMDGSHVLRGSFTTFRVLDNRGTWTRRHGLSRVGSTV